MDMSCSEGKKGRKVPFHNKHGPNIRLSGDGYEATRVNGAGIKDGYGVVFTSEPVPVGCMFKVAALESASHFKGGLGIFFTTEDPQNSQLTKSWIAVASTQSRFFADIALTLAMSSAKIPPAAGVRTRMAAALESPGLVGVFANRVFCGGRPILPVNKKLTKSTETLAANNSVGIRLVRAAENKVMLEVYFSGKLLKIVTLPNGYPLSKPLYGVVDVYGTSTKVKASITPAAAVAEGISEPTPDLSSKATLDVNEKQKPVDQAASSPSLKILVRQLQDENSQLKAELDKRAKQLDEEQVRAARQADIYSREISKLKSQQDRLMEQLAKVTRALEQKKQKADERLRPRLLPSLSPRPPEQTLRRRSLTEGRSQSFQLPSIVPGQGHGMKKS